MTPKRAAVISKTEKENNQHILSAWKKDATVIRSKDLSLQ